MDKYFHSFAEPEVQLLEGFNQHYHQVLCLPVFDEQSQFLDNLKPALSSRLADKAQQKTLIIMVINQPQNSPTCKNNQRLFELACTQKTLWQKDHLRLSLWQENCHILWINRFEEGLQIPIKQGVGLARKIAADIACFLQAKGHIKSSYFFSSDADVVFPDDYFTANIDNTNSAAVLAFEHLACGDKGIDHATQIYQASLHDYVDNLQRIGSPYAYHTIGSTLVINCEAYIKVRGFPKRSGAEDFYLLNKLNKIKPVLMLSSPTIGIQSRISHRVPFGTGPAVEKLLTQESALFFHPNSFATLATWLAFLNIISGKEVLDIKNSINKQPDVIQSLSKEFKLLEAVEKIWQNHHQEKARRQQLTNWFDAFQTLKMLNYLSNNYWPKLDFKKWQLLNSKA